MTRRSFTKVGASRFSVVVVLMDDGRFSIGVRIFLLNHNRAVVRLPLLDDGCPVTVAVLTMILAYRDTRANWNNVNTNVIREDRRRDSANQCSND
jgi:hypothetical protein